MRRSVLLVHVQKVSGSVTGCDGWFPAVNLARLSHTSKHWERSQTCQTANVPWRKFCETVPFPHHSFGFSPM